MISVDELKRLFEVKEDQELADIFGRTPGAVSNWRKSSVPASIERRAHELLQAKGIDAVYGQQSVHRNLTPDQEMVLEALEGDPLAQLFVMDMLKLEGDELAQAYADFRKKWKGKKETGDQ